ncbi:hypothetical protein AY599_01820 [Leptolyngbya valderiana BDU 20041]|nr:hypothetical protein AY599_01820 [Leptolyngbya valderiana BDU 20041]
MWLCVGCRSQSDPDAQPAFDLIDPSPVWVDGQLYFDTAMAWRPSDEVVEALHHGVVVPLELSIRIARHHGVVASEDRTHHHRFEIRYLPLLRDYEVWDVRADQRSLHPRLSILTAFLAERRRFSTGLSADEVAERRWQVQLRAHLDRTRLPSPMRLPVWFDERWSAQGPWYSWIFPVEVDS